MKISSVSNMNIYSYKNSMPYFGQAKKVGATNPNSEDRERKIKEVLLPSGETVYEIESRDERDYTSRSRELLEIPSRFELRGIDRIPCPACGKLMLPLNKKIKIDEEFDKANPEDYLKILNKYSKYMRPVEYSVLADIQKISDKTGEKDIRKLLESLRDSKLPILEDVQFGIINEMKNLAHSLPRQEKRDLLSKIDELSKKIRSRKTEAPFRRKALIEEIKQVKIKNPHNYQKLQNLARSFPRSFDLNSSWVVKYSGDDKYGKPWESKDIAKRMLDSAVPNTDHIIARDIELHRDEIPNYMAMHEGCNTLKKDKSFNEWYDENPKVIDASIRAYVAKAESLIKAGRVHDSRYDNYVEMVTDVIREASDGKVDLTKKD